MTGLTTTSARSPAPARIALALCLLWPTGVAAQVGTDSLSRSSPSEYVPVPSTGMNPGQGAGDTAALPVPVSTPRAQDSAPAPEEAPTDTTLKRVCTGAAPGALAPGLLAVVFRPGTTKEEAIGAAKAIGGRIGGMSDMGEVYVLVPPETGRLSDVADQLIRQDPVTRVAPTPCPTRSPAPAAPAAPPAAAPPAAGVQPPPPVPTDTSGARARDSTAPAR